MARGVSETTRGIVERLEADAVSSWGLVTWREARAAGLPPRTIANLRQSRRWRLIAALDAPGRKDRAAVARVERVLALRGDVPWTGSLLETLFVQLCRRFDIPTSARQLEVTTAGNIRTHPDFAWVHPGAFAELDGEGHKGQPLYDSRRQTAIVAATGWLCIRATWTEVTRNPTPTAHRVLAVLDHARRRELLR